MKKGKKLINTFRFQNFAERIGNINIDIHRNNVVPMHEVPENDKDTFFRESLEKWNELNCSLDFTQLYRKLRPLVQSFNQLIYHKNDVVEILQQCLEKDESLAFEPCLELLSQLAKDLLEDFYVYFERFFPILVKFLKTQNTKLIEQTFVCFAHIFKFIWKCMIENLTDVFQYFSLLLSSKQKLHVRVFAAEAFAFLIRKSKGKEKTILFLLKQVDEDLAEGVGHLLFQSVKGITGRLSLNAEEFLDMALKSVSNFTGDEVLRTFQTMWNAALRHVEKENSALLFTVLLKNIELYVSSRSENSNTLSCYLQLLELSIAFKKGYYIPDQNAVLQVISANILSLSSVQGASKALQNTISTFVKCHHCKIPDEEISVFLNLYISQDELGLSDKIAFFRLLFQWVKFDSLVKPLILQQMTKQLSTSSKKNTKKAKTDKALIFNFFVDIVFMDGTTSLCKPFPTNVFDGENDVIFDFPRFQGDRSDVDEIFLKDITLKTLKENTEWFWILTIVLMNSRVNQTERLFTSVCTILEKSMQQENLENVSGFYLFTLSHTIQCALLLSCRCNNEDEMFLSFSLMVKLLETFPSNENILKCFQSYVSFLIKRKMELPQEKLLQLCDVIKTNLSSSSKLNRLLTLMIIKNFSGYMECSEKDKQALLDCIEAENVDADLDTYRSKMMHLQKLSVTEPGQFTRQYSDFILRYLIGTLFVNFSVIWDPITKVISSHATKENETQFWEIWKEMLHVAAQYCRKTNEQVEEDEDAGKDEQKEMNVPKKYFFALKSFKEQQRPDYLNFRNLLWTAMTHFPRLAEKKSRDIVPLFFEYLEEEYTVNDELLAHTQDLTKSTEKPGPSKTSTSPSHSGKLKVKCLCAHLKIFTLFKNPKSSSKEKQLFQCYMNFLVSKEHDVQLLALNCLRTYNFPYLKPYTDSFDKLMDDATFRDELVRYSSENADASIYQEEHKHQLMPILIRLLYGKLQRRSGLGMSGKTSHSVRRNIIMHFLANCGSEDINTFVQLMVDPLKGFEGKPMLSKDCTVDVTSVVPLQRQAGYCNMLSNVITRLRTLVTPYLPLLISTLLKIIWNASWCVSNKQKEIAAYVTRLKDLQRNGVFKLIEIFNTMPNLELKDQVEEIFQAAVWPKLAKLSMDSCQNMTPLCHLIVCWSSHSRFFPLFAVEDEEGNTLLSSFYQILNQKFVGSEVEKQLMTVALNLLTRPNHEADGNNGTEIRVDRSFNKNESIGVQLIRPFVGKLLDYLYKNLHNKTDKMKLKTKQKLNHIIPNLQLDVLANISKFVTDREQCEKIVLILFPLLRCVATEQIQTYIMTTINNLLPYVTNFQDHLHLIPTLFSNFYARKPRALLCALYTQMTESDPILSPMAHHLSAMNSWDEQHLDEPDYEKRITAYREVTNQVKEKKIQMDNLTAVLHNCFFFIGTTDDMSIRDASSAFVETVIKYMNDDEGFEKVVFRTMLPSIRHGLKSKNQITRYEFVQLLALLVRSFQHDSFSDLLLLCSENPETDFYENIRHVQSHRRTRALQHLNRLCEDKKMHPNNLFTFLLPLISHAVFDNLSQTKDHNLLSETISVIGNIVNCLPWSKYFLVLKNYLTVLQKDKKNQKTIIRVVVSLLNNFPFDLSTVDPACAQVEITNLTHNKSSANQQTEEESKQSNVSTNQIKEKAQSVNEMNDQGEESDDVDDDEDNVIEIQQKENKARSLEHIYIALTTKLLPRLKKFFLRKSASESFHKMSKNHGDDEEEIMKVPVALAIVKMLQHLPQETLTNNLPGLILRVSQALKSQARDVREAARDTLKKILRSLGMSYLHLMAKEMKSVLQRGYQLHVLGFTVHAMLEFVQEDMKSGDLDESVVLLMEIITEELFGTVAEEKEVEKIVVKLHEAKSKKSNELLEILAKYITGGTVHQLIAPLKQVLDTTHDHKTTKRVEEALRRVGLGLQNNKDISGEEMLIFVHGVVSSTVSNMLTEDELNSEVQKKPEPGASSREDIFIIPEQPARGGKKPGMLKQTNEHVFVEFGLQLLHTGLKRQKYLPNNPDHIRMLDPFVAVALSSMSSKHGRIITLTLRCISMMVRFALPSLKKEMPRLAKNLFKTIKKYGRVGAGQGENFEMIFSAFKAMTVIIRDHKLSVTNKQLQILLSYVEEDIHDTTRQSTALPLLKAILSRKLTIPLVHDVMKKIAELVVRDPDEVIRSQCRQLVIIYMLDYPLGKNLFKLLDFFVSQLSYDEETGRASILELFASIFRSFPTKTLTTHAGYFFIPLVMMLVNDESARCRKMAAAAVKLLLTKSNTETRNELFDIVNTWKGHEKILLRQLSMQLMGMFVEVAEDEIEMKLDAILPTITSVLEDGVSALHDEDDDDDDDEDSGDELKLSKGDSGITDKLLYNALTCLGKLLTKSSSLLCSETYIAEMNTLLGMITELLLHSHSWIRLSASQLFGYYFASTSGKEGHYFAENMEVKVKDLCYVFYDQLKDNNLSKEIAEQTTKNLIYLTRKVIRFDSNLELEGTTTIVEEKEQNRDDEGVDSGRSKPITLKILIRKMNQLATYELNNSPKQSVKRSSVFRWIAALCIELEPGQLLPHLPSLLYPINRNITTSKEQDGELYKLAQEVMEMIRSVVDKQSFAEAFSKLQKKVSQNREARKRKLAIEAVSDPVSFALRKQKINLAKREQKKRKLYEHKPILKFKKIRSKPED